MKEQRAPWNRRHAIAVLLAALVVPTTTMLSGCGGGGGGSGEFAQEFEKPETPVPEPTLPPDTGDDLSPRERRSQQ